jgi:hypothetical protein
VVAELLAWLYRLEDADGHAQPRTLPE